MCADGNQHATNVSHAMMISHSAQIHPQLSPPQYARLKVEDALTYLDKVKLQFSNQPNVYNDFLDIMKEFKTQAIDTPGVITRVSCLFKGHPDLIVGFNTFLPPGYKIELNANDTISVYQPGQKMITSPIAPPTLQSRQPLMLNQQSSGLLNAAVSYERHQSRDYVSESQRLQPAHTATDNQPVEFNHAINYVNKIKMRYHGKPETYKTFLEILHKYQKDQRDIKLGIPPSGRVLTESEVFAQVASLFKDDSDLLDEFSHFLPDASGSSPLMGDLSETALNMNIHASNIALKKMPVNSTVKSCISGINSTSQSKLGQRRRLSTVSSNTPVYNKKLKTEMLRDVSMAEAGKYSSLNEYAFFDKVRRSLGSVSYRDFLRCLLLYNQRVCSREDLLQMVQQFSSKMPDLKKQMKLLLRPTAGPIDLQVVQQNKERMLVGELASEIDLLSCKELSHSYRGLPASFIHPVCSGRTSLDCEVLNDTVVSIASWSEDSSSVIKKTAAEDQIFRCEDDRYQTEIYLENINSLILSLLGVAAHIDKMTTDEKSKFHLDENLGGRSEVLHRTTLQKLYTKEHASTVIEALKKSPEVCVPVVLRRLQAKAEQLRDAKNINMKTWNDINQKHYPRSLDHQGVNFKQIDTKLLRSKALIHEIDTAFTERQNAQYSSVAPTVGESLINFVYQGRTQLEDGASLIIHHMKRQTSIHQDEKQKIKRFLKQFLPDLFFVRRGELSDDDADKDHDVDKDLDMLQDEENKPAARCDWLPFSPNDEKDKTEYMSNSRDDCYSLIFGNTNWYVFIRLHYVLCDRLYTFYQLAEKAKKLEEDASLVKKSETIETAVALRLKSPRLVEPKNYYEYLLSMVRSYLDGNMEYTIYEEQLRDMFGIQAYPAFNMDKLIQNIVRQLQCLVTDSNCIQLMELYEREKVNMMVNDYPAPSSQRSLAESVYQAQAEQLRPEEGCFRIIIYKKECRLSIDLLDSQSTVSDEQTGADEWTDYIDNYANDESLPEEMIEWFKTHPLYMKRNIRRFRHVAGRSESGTRRRSRTESQTTLDGRTTGDSHTIMDDTECKFLINSKKMFFVRNSEQVCRRRKKPKQHVDKLSARQHVRFTSYISKWLTCAPVDCHTVCEDWLMGRIDGLLPCTTTKHVIGHVGSPPYYLYNKYLVEYKPFD